ncbi:hypothetical protein BJY04DRAFT_204117 [Aspergillus karnatakaensis]|uniref:uncharacterized protein n=1 Tax=Aspergillus karnatakaensis TaxID=1810916 RepID=UPI003CCDCB92
MKLTTLLTPVLLSLSLSTPTTAWDCTAGGGPGHSGLRQIHRDFNRLFGEARLTARPRQCYFAVCSGLIFGYCNRHGVTTTEVANHRNIVAGQDPGTGANCGTVAESNRPYHLYIYGTTSSLSLGGSNNVIRRC